jgi:hypothetical protein
MSLSTNNLSLINPDKISSKSRADSPKREIDSPTPLCSIPEISYKEFIDYDKYTNEEIKYKEEIKLPDINLTLQDNNQKLFYKRTDTKPLLKKTAEPKIGQMATFGRMTFEYRGGF